MSEENNESPQPEMVHASSRPMVYVTRTASKDPADISEKMGEAFQILGDFLARNGVQPLGPPLTIYTEVSDNGMTMNIGVPVPPPALANATGELRGGVTPPGRAFKLVHRGPYDGLRATYDAMRAYFRDHDLAAPGLAWEVYVNDPSITPEEDLITEIYMRSE
jgi:effector-binding domain-containing protein